MSSTLTAEIAAVAARLVVDEGMEYGPAKRRAARDLGKHAVRKPDLPSNDEIEDEVRRHIALFCADTQPAELAALRAVAIEWMERLQAFRPHLTGAVWRGTATRLNAVHIELYCDDSKEAEIALINEHVDYDVQAGHSPNGHDVDVLAIAARSKALNDTITVFLTVLDRDDLRGALKPDPRGQTLRGDLAALRARMAQEAT